MGNSFCYLIVHGGGQTGDVAPETCQTTQLVAAGRGTVPINRGTELRLLSGSITLLRGYFYEMIVPHPTAVGMEGFTSETEAACCYRYLSMPGVLSVPTARFLSQTARLFHLVHITVIFGMGRPSWATPEQLEYLKSWLPHLPCAKKTTGLQTMYMQAYEGFLLKWEPAHFRVDPDESPEQITARAKEKLLSVRI